MGVEMAAATIYGVSMLYASAALRSRTSFSGPVTLLSRRCETRTYMGELEASSHSGLAAHMVDTYGASDEELKRWCQESAMAVSLR